MTDQNREVHMQTIMTAERVLSIQAASSDPYGSLIERFFASEFPQAVGGDFEQLIDQLTSAFVATAQTRFGPAPKPEGLVALRTRLRYWVEKQQPIAVLSPWGSAKPDGSSGVDVAEVMALRTLAALGERVRRFYQPGVEVHLGVEDVGGRYLWRGDERMLQGSAHYVETLQQLVTVLGVPGVRVVPESKLVSEGRFFGKANEFLEPLARLVPTIYHGGEADSEEYQAIDWAHLNDLGWKGGISREMLQHYMGSYQRLYPALSETARLHRLAEYLAQSAARYAVGAKLLHPSWAGVHVQVNFTQPVPGMPAEMADHRLFYRAVPMRYSRTHLPPWRAKGYLLITDGDEVVPKVAAWGSVSDLQGCAVDFSDGVTTVPVAADYLVGVPGVNAEG